MRTRRRNLAPTPGFYYLDRSFSDGKRQHTDYPFSSPSWIRNESITDVVTPNFKVRQAAGEIFNNPFSYSKLTRDSTPGSFVTTVIGDSTVSDTWSGDLAVLAISQPIVYNESPVANRGSHIPSVKLSAISNMDKPDYNFGEDSLEIRETFATLRQGLLLLKNPLKEVRAIAERMKKASNRNRRVLNMNNFDAVNSAYLQYRFALSPLMRSVMDGLEAMEKDISKLQPRYYSRAKKIVSDTHVSSGQASFATVKRTIKTDRTTRATIMYQVFNAEHDWRFQLGFRNKDIIPTLWAVAPRSFMVDRVIDISRSLTAMINLADSDIRILAASVSTKTVVTTKYEVKTLSRAPYIRSGTVGDVTDTNVSYTRDPWKPQFFDAIPELTPSNLVSDLTNTADLFAIMYTFLSSPNK